MGCRWGRGREGADREPLIHFFPPNFVRVTNFPGISLGNVKEIGIDRQQRALVSLRHIRSCLWSLGSAVHPLAVASWGSQPASQLLSRQTKGERERERDSRCYGMIISAVCYSSEFSCAKTFSAKFRESTSSRYSDSRPKSALWIMYSASHSRNLTGKVSHD